MRAGIVKVRIEELPHKVFERHGDNLKMYMHISLKESLIGFEREIKHLDGHLVEVDHSGKVTKPGQIEKIKGEGFVKSDFSGNFGDLIITFVVDYPKELTEEQNNLWK